MGNISYQNNDLELAEAIRKACVEEAKNGFRDASMSGLCADGAMEAAVSAIQKLDLTKIVDRYHKSTS